MSDISRREFDIVIATDLRFPGGNSSSTGEEIKAQVAAGYRTGLLHVPSPVVRVTRAFNSRLVDVAREGQVELIPQGVQVRTKLLVIRHPTVLPNLVPALYPIESERRVVVVNQIGQVGDRVIYQADQVGPEFEARYGPTVWAPISPVIRKSLEPHADSITIAADDWFNIIDVDEWYRPRVRPGSPPIIGRHSRDHEMKWPASADDILAAYPPGEEFEVRVLGGAQSVQQVLGEVPPQWEVMPYAVDGAREFLRNIDFFVYFHHADLREAFGRAIFEALASGAVAIVPEEYESLFGTACIYAEPHEVQEIIRAYVAGEASYQEQSARGVEFARAKFGHHIHRSRISALIGPPAERADGIRASSRRVRERRRLMFMSSNGAGVGHLTRLMAMARRASPEFQPVIFTLSQGIRWVEDSGFPVEYLASQRYLAGDRPNVYWNRLLQHRLEHLIDLYDPVGLIFDGTQPYRGLLDTFEAHPEIAAVWSRRGMWRPHITKNLKGLSEHFDLVIEAGEIASSSDRGITKAFQKYSTVVDPITFLDADEILLPSEARAQLGLAPDQPTALIQLGAGNINDTSSLVNAAVTTLAEDPRFQIRIARSAISGRLDSIPGVEWVDAYPLSKYIHGFDLVVGAAGYNTFHELIGFGVPSVIVPNTATEVDDQVGRAEFARASGAAFVAHDIDEMREAVQRLMRVEERDRMRAALGRLRPERNGAIAAIAAYEEAVRLKQGSAAG